jgi:hypothetical protein
MKLEKDLYIKFNASLNKLDSEDQTYGCRANNPNICGSCYMEGVCAFVCDDEICKRPTNAWKKQYNKLSKGVKYGKI